MADTLEKVQRHGGLKGKAAEAGRTERDNRLQSNIISCGKMSTTNTFAVTEDILKVIKTNEVINMPHFENCSIILKSKVSHLFFSLSLDNKKKFYGSIVHPYSPNPKQSQESLYVLILQT